MTEINVENDDGEMEIKRIPFLKSYSVYNVAQCEGIPMPKKAKAKKFTPLKANKLAEKVIENYKLQEPKLKISVGDNKLSRYFPSLDKVEVTSMGNHCATAKKNGDSVYVGKHNYYLTFFHELIHSTMIKERLDRISKFGGFNNKKHDYSLEELTAEFGSMMVANECGIKSKKAIENAQAYIMGWWKVLDNNPEMLYKGATLGYKAKEYLLGRHLENK